MPKLVANHARPIAGGVTTIMSVGEESPTPIRDAVRDTLVIHLETPLAFAGAASLLGSKKPGLWALIGLGVSIFANGRR